MGAEMGSATSIEWTDATWNPVTGCTKISAGCLNCYAERFSERFRNVKGHPFQNGFDLKLRPERLDQPLKWRTGRMIFVNSMSDLFHKEVPQEYIDKIFDTMEEASWHTFQVLTKRSSRMRKYILRRYSGLDVPSHIWIGVSAEDSSKLSRVHQLIASPISVRFLSLEPLLGPMPIVPLGGISWVIVGGESGPRARPMAASWVREIRDQCKTGGVPFFFKQWGGIRPKSGGRTLDGKEWNQLPVQQGRIKNSVTLSGRGSKNLLGGTKNDSTKNHGLEA
jgi:protein gp37